MIFTETPIVGAWQIDVEFITDRRGAFGRLFSSAEFGAHGLANQMIETSVSCSPLRHTLRGLHYQADPHGEVKLVRCTRGAVYDVALDLRPDSPSFLRWHALELSGENHRSFYIPRGVAHGFLTLTPDAEVLYNMDAPHVASAARGVRWNDPRFGIDWPAGPVMISERDRDYPDFTD